jgi:L-fuconolactonase
MVIDSHQHFWKYTPEEFGWLSGGLEKLRRDFTPADLFKELNSAGVDGVVAVQARTTTLETQTLLALAKDNSLIKAVVGWVDLLSPDVEKQIETYESEKLLKSFRHIVQGETDPRFLQRSDFQRGIQALFKKGYTYDLLIYAHQLPSSIEFVDRFPMLPIVLDHIAKPRIAEGEIDIWKKNIRELAKRENVYCKISGMVTEADFEKWTPAQLEPYFLTVLEAFGPDRLMFGSDWPVCTAACSYQNWISLVRDWSKKLSDSEQKSIFGETAIKAYRIEVK